MKERIFKKKIKKRVFSVALALAMVFSLLPNLTLRVNAAPVDNVQYIDATGASQTATSCTLIQDRASDHLTAGWYLVQGEQSIANVLELEDGVNLILADNSSLTVSNWIWMKGALNVWAQSDGENVGKLNVSYADSFGNVFYAGSTTALTVNGGEVNISGVHANVNCFGNTCDLIVNGGTVTVKGGKNAMDKAPTLGSGIEVITASANVDGSSPVETYASSDITTYKYLEIGKTAPQHTWGYTSVDATLTATCNKGCGAETAHTATLTLTATGENYSDITGLDAFNEATGRTEDSQKIKESDVKIFKVTTEGATTGGTEVDKPTATDYGYYYASLTVGTATAVKAFTIDDPRHTVTFDLNGKPGTAPEPQKVEDGETVIRPYSPGTAECYVYEWFKDPDCKQTWDFYSDTVTSDITLYALWADESVVPAVISNPAWNCEYHPGANHHYVVHVSDDKAYDWMFWNQDDADATDKFYFVSYNLSGLFDGNAPEENTWYYYDEASDKILPCGGEIFFEKPASGGTNPDGTNPDGTNPDGTNPDGTNPDGTNPDGTNPDGTTPDGTNPDGTTPDGTNPDGTTPDGTTPEEEPVKEIVTKPVYRVYNPNSGLHFYTVSEFEKDYLVSLGWNEEGIDFYAPEYGAAVYRAYNSANGDHYFTTSKAEIDALVANGWNDEGLAWYSDGELSVYKVKNPNAKKGQYFYTSNKKEYEYLVSLGWEDLGVAWKSMLTW